MYFYYIDDCIERSFQDESVSDMNVLLRRATDLSLKVKSCSK
jgi:hypothetical protein